MAMWYQARQRASDGKWHYTASSDESTELCYPVGACADDCPGHDTAAEAQEHYHQGICAGEIKERDSDQEQKKCVECDAWTQHRAMLWEDHFREEVAVCASHDIRAALTKDYMKRKHR